MIVVKTMNNYVKTFSPDCDIFRDRKTMKLRLSKLGINMDNKFRLKEEDLNAFIKQFTTYKSYDDFVNKKGLVIV
jgi:SPX domain protein involved in polyphosphate accumulation